MQFATILKRIKGQKDKKIASSLFAKTLDQLLNFKNIFTITGEVTIPFITAMNTSGEISVSASTGNGNFEISSVISEQFELLGSISFDMSNGSIKFDTDGSINIEYSVDIDKYNTIAASISGKPGVSISAGYTITTTDKYDNSVSTSLELTHTKNKFPPTGLMPNESYFYEKETSKSYDWYWLRAVAGVILLGIAFGTDAIGIAIDDPILIPIGAALLGRG